MRTQNLLPVVSLITALALTACSGDDQLPGAQKAGERDPLFSGTPLFFIERPIVNGTNELTDPITYVGDAHLIMKDRAEAGAPETVISDLALSGSYDVRDLDVSFDGNYVIFSLRKAPIAGANDSDQPTWNLWEYDIRANRVTRVISSDITAEQGHDITPRYINENDDIVFASTRQTQTRATLLNEIKPAYSGLDESRQQEALNLHLLVRSSANIRQLSFNMSHDMYPAVMPSGKIVYSRWDNFNQNAINLYQMYPDGTANELLYGYHSHDTGFNDSDFHFVKPYAMPNGDLLVLARPLSSTQPGGDFITIDTDNYVDNFQPTATTNGSGPAQVSATLGDVRTDTNLSPGGYFAAFFPLPDGSNRVLASWQQCRTALNGLILPCSTDNLSNPAATAAPPAYSLWMFDLNKGTQVPILAARSNRIFTDAVLAASRPTPTAYSANDSLKAAVLNGKITNIQQAELTDTAVEEAIIHIRNVYDFDGTTDPAVDYANWSNPSLSDAEERLARFLRVIKGVPEPSNEVRTLAQGSYGASSAQLMKEIIGYAPIEPDGSVKIRVPANVPLMLSVTNEAGQRVYDRHQNWISLKPGEVMECKGCHTPSSELPHGRYDAQASSTNQGQPQGAFFPGAASIIAAPFPNATMAEAKARDDESTMVLSPNLLYTDTWTDSFAETPDPDWQLRYEDIPLYSIWTEQERPANSNCSPIWNGRCRIIINYEDHIQPLWELDRDTNNPGATFAVASQHDNGTTTCIRCHNLRDETNTPQIPAGQLELTGELDGTNGIQIRSYVELFFADIEKVDDAGSIVDCTEPQLDANNNPVLDSGGQPVMVLCQPTIPPTMSAAGALNSSFFDVFAPGTGSHRDYLTPAELRLISEWLDIGGQYFNNHFDAPAN